MRRFIAWSLVVGVIGGGVVGLGATPQPKGSPHAHSDACGGCGAGHGAPVASLVGRKVAHHAFIVLVGTEGLKEGAKVTVADLLKRDGVRGLVLDFVGANCPASRQQLQGVARALSQRDGPAKKVLVATVFVDPDAQKVRAALKGRRLNALVLWDKGGQVARQWQVKTTPTVVAIRKDGRVAATYTGMAPPLPEIYPHFFSAVLVALAKGDALPPQPMMGMGGG